MNDENLNKLMRALLSTPSNYSKFRFFIGNLPEEPIFQTLIPSHSQILGSVVTAPDQARTIIESDLSTEQLYNFYTQVVRNLGGEAFRRLKDENNPHETWRFMTSNFDLSIYPILFENQSVQLNIQVNFDESYYQKSAKDLNDIAIDYNSENILLLQPPSIVENYTVLSGVDFSGQYLNMKMTTTLETVELFEYFNQQLENLNWEKIDENILEELACSNWQSDQFKGYLSIIQLQGERNKKILFLHKEN